MKCLSVNEPWASLIIHGHPFGCAPARFKDVENRTWSVSYRGPLLIHAGQHVQRDVFESLHLSTDTKTRSGILGVVTLVDCTRIQTSIWHQDGFYGWYLTNPIPFTYPIHLPGKLGLFDVPIEFDPTVTPDLRWMTCPQCATWLQTPNDRHGVMWHETCGYCSHPSITEGTCQRCHDSIQRC